MTNKKMLFSLPIVVGIIFFLITLIFLGFNLLKPKESSGMKTVTIDNVSFEVEVADTYDKQVQGLSGRISLPEDQGMLFVMEKSGIYDFWMKDMKFPIDIIWIKNNQVVDISKNVPAPKPDTPDEQIPSYKPKTYCDQVLELNAGTVEKYGIKVGDEVMMKK